MRAKVRVMERMRVSFGVQLRVGDRVRASGGFSMSIRNSARIKIRS